jgi:hypothetical protein
MIATAVLNPASPNGSLIWTSSNSGATWVAQTTLVGAEKGISNMAVDASGAIALASCGLPSVGTTKCLLSTDHGANWSQPAGFSAPASASTVDQVVTADAVKMATTEVTAGAGGPFIITSTNSGVTWNNVHDFSPASGPTYLCSSSDGSIGYVTDWILGFLYKSTDWFATVGTDIGPGGANFATCNATAASCSYDGQVIVIAQSLANIGHPVQGTIFVSTNGGVSWNAVTPS